MTRLSVSKSLNRLHLGAAAVVMTGMLAVAPGWLSAERTLPPVPEGRGLSVVSLNLAMETNPDVIVRELERHPALRNADVFLLQEVIHPGGDEPSTAERLADRMNLHVLTGPSEPTATINALAILSRYPVSDPVIFRLKAFNLRLRSRSRVALGATVRTPSGPVRVFNVHLDTRINAVQRLEQIEPVIEQAKAFAGPRIIGGDFNTNNMRWIGHVIPLPYTHFQTTAVQHLMQAKGFATPFGSSGATHDFLNMHLDWVFHTDLDARAYGVQPMKFSDHHALWTWYALSTRTAQRPDH